MLGKQKTNKKNTHNELVKDWSRLPRKIAGILSLKILRTQLDATLSKLNQLWNCLLLQAEIWARYLQSTLQTKITYAYEMSEKAAILSLLRNEKGTSYKIGNCAAVEVIHNSFLQQLWTLFSLKSSHVDDSLSCKFEKVTNWFTNYCKRRGKILGFKKCLCSCWKNNNRNCLLGNTGIRFYLPFTNRRQGLTKAL